MRRMLCATVVVIVNYHLSEWQKRRLGHFCDDEIFHAVDLFMVPQKAINLRLLLLPCSCDFDLRFQCSSLHHCSSFCEIKGSEDTVNLGSNYLLGKYSNCDQCLDLCLPHCGIKRRMVRYLPDAETESALTWLWRARMRTELNYCSENCASG